MTQPVRASAVPQFIASPRLGRATICSAFFALGFLPTTWAVHIPRVKGLLNLSDGELGLSLCATALGLFLGMTLGGWIVERLRSRFVSGAAAACLALATILAVTSTSSLRLVMALVPSGFFSGLLDVAANSQAAAFERRSGRAAMSFFHGFFSLGGLAGAMFGVGLAGLDVAPLAHVLLAAVPFVIWGCAMHRTLIPEATPQASRFFVSVPSRDLLPLAVMAFVFFLVEGAIFDWSGVFLNARFGVGTSGTGIGYGAFSLLMAAVRLCGESWIRRFGRLTIFVSGALVGAAGLALASLAPAYGLSIAGFGLMGAGLANCIPLLLSAAARRHGGSSSRAIASVASSGYFGLFAGPPLIGVVAQSVGLQSSLLLVSGTLVVSLVLTRTALGDRAAREPAVCAEP